MVSRIVEFLQNQLDYFRLRLANPEALILLSMFAVLTGLLTGLVIVSFRLALEHSQMFLLPSGEIEDFESLPDIARFLLPCAAGLVLGVLFQSLGPHDRQVGIVHVIERLQYHQGRFRWRNMVLQFVGALVAIGGGHSLGREGPSVHMGAYSGSWIAQRMRLPNNSTRTLVACGTAAAIGASFNTPLAGIIFAMEVIMKQYTVQGFVPVILAAVSGTYLSLGFLEEDLFFTVNLMSDNLAYDWPLITLLGILLGMLSAFFNFALIQISRLTTPWPIWVRFTLAGFLMGCVAWWVPEAMGTGYDTVNDTLNAQIGMELLVWILLAKLLATLICFGLGMPGGVIGPLMFIGSVAGSALVLMAYYSGNSWFIPTEPSLYPVLGMGAMFAASLQAPLAGLTAVMELAGNADIILPAMLAIVFASLTNKAIFHHDSLFRSLLQARGLDHATSPVMQRLRMIGAASVMTRSFARYASIINRDVARATLNQGKQWVMIIEYDEPKYLLRALDLYSYIETHPDMDEINLYEIPGKRLQLTALSVRASLQEAVDELKRSHAEALYLHHEKTSVIYGVLTHTKIQRSYQ